MGFPIGNFRPKLTQNRKSDKILKKIENRYFQQVSIVKMNILTKFHKETTIFGEIRGYLLILPFYRALTRAADGLLLRMAIHPRNRVKRSHCSQKE